MVAQKATEPDDDIFDLTELLEKGEAASPVANGAQGDAQELKSQIDGLNEMPIQADAEIDALLAQMDSGDMAEPYPAPAPTPAPASGAAPAERKVDPNEALDMPGMGDVDDLLNNLDIPPQPHERSEPTQPKADTESSLDNAVDDLLNAMGGGTDVHDLLAAATPDQGLPDDLDILLGGSDTPAAAKMPSKPAPMDDDLDALLAQAAAPSGVKASAAKAGAAAPAGDDLDLDAFLADMEAPPVAPKAAAPAPKAARPAAAAKEVPMPPAPAAEPVDLDALLDGMGEASAPVATLQAEDLNAHVASLLDEVGSPAQEGAGQTAEPQDTLDQLLEQELSPLPDEGEALTEALSDLSERLLDQDESPASTPDEEAQPDNAPAAEADKAGKAAEELTELAADMEADLDDLLAAMDPEALAPDENADMPEGALPLLDEDLLGEAAFAAPGSAAALSADDTPLSDLNGRLRQCESELGRAVARIDSLERGVSPVAAPASMQELFTPGSPLHDSFAALISTSVRQALETIPGGLSGPALEERFQSMSLSNKSLSARMDALENRIDSLEPRFNQQVEKAAAAAAARILREEIAKLLQG